MATYANPAADLRAAKQDTPNRPPVRGNNAPSVITGDSFNDSTPFRFTKAIGLLSGALAPEQAKLENEVMNRFTELFKKSNCYSNLGIASNAKILPVMMRFLPDEITQSPDGLFCKSYLEADFNYDPEYVFRKAAGNQNTIDGDAGGYLVEPPKMGDLIPLMRNKSAVDRAGARTIGLPPNGKMVFPKETGASTAYWVKENNQVDVSTGVTLGQVVLQARKLMSTTRVPSEFISFTSGNGEAVLRNNIATSIALAYDYAALYGSGNGDPRGLINYTGTGELYDYAAATPAPVGLGTDGNAVKVEDGNLIQGVIEDRNFDDDITAFKWIMRPRMLRRLCSISADAITAGDEAGVFKTSLLRDIGFGITKKEWAGSEVITSTQVRDNQSKGSSGATLTEIFGGNFSKGCLLGTLGIMVFETLNGGMAEITADQVVFRAKMFGDVAYTQPGAFAWYKQLKFSK